MATLVTRRQFTAILATSVATAATPLAFAAPGPKFQNMPVGYTGITWMNSQVDDAIATVARLGFYGFETFGDVLTQWAQKGGLKPVLDGSHIPLISGYCTLNLTESTRRQEMLDKAKNYAVLIKKTGGRIFVVGPNQVDLCVRRAQAEYCGVTERSREDRGRSGTHACAPSAHRNLRRIAG